MVLRPPMCGYCCGCGLCGHPPVLQAFAGQRVHAFRMAHPLDKDTFVNRILTWFHRINGKVTLVAAAYNMTLGVRMLTTDPILLHGLTVYLCLVGTVFAIAETRKQLFLFRFHRVRARRTSKHGCVLCCVVLRCVGCDAQWWWWWLWSLAFSRVASHVCCLLATPLDRVPVMTHEERVKWLSRISESYGPLPTTTTATATMAGVPTPVLVLTRRASWRVCGVAGYPSRVATALQDLVLVQEHAAIIRALLKCDPVQRTPYDLATVGPCPSAGCCLLPCDRLTHTLVAVVRASRVVVVCAYWKVSNRLRSLSFVAPFTTVVRAGVPGGAWASALTVRLRVCHDTHTHTYIPQHRWQSLTTPCGTCGVACPSRSYRSCGVASRLGAPPRDCRRPPTPRR